MPTYNDEEHELDILEDIFEYLNLDEPTNEQLYELYGVFKRDMIDEPIYINLVQLGYNKTRSRHPMFKGKPEGFEHICTRESKHSKRRNFDPERANKIHWIKPVILNKDDNRIKYFERLHYTGQNQQYYWLKEKDYVVIVREITTNLQLVTAFKVDEIEKGRFQNWYNVYHK